MTPNPRRRRVGAENSEKPVPHRPTLCRVTSKERKDDSCLSKNMQYIMKISLKSLEQGLISVFTPSLVNYSHCTCTYHETFSFAPFPSHSTLILQYALTLEHLGSAS